MKELVKLSKITRTEFTKITICDTWRDMMSAGLAGPIERGEMTESVPAIIYNYDADKDEWKMFAFSKDIMMWNAVSHFVPEAKDIEEFKKLISEGGDVAIAADINLDAPISVSNPTVLNLGGHNITAQSTNKKAAITATKDLTIEGAGNISASKKTIVVEGAKLTVNLDGTIESGNQGITMTSGEVVFNSGKIISQECAITAIGKDSKTTINGGEFTTKDNGAVMMNGTSGNIGNTLEINGGIFNCRIESAGYVANAVYSPNDDVITINGGEFNVEGGCGVCARAGKTIINGGTFRTTGNAIGKVGDARQVVPCAAIVFDEVSTYPGLTEESVIEINGGTFISEVDPVHSVDDHNNRIVIKGGKFSADVTTWVADGFVCELGEDGLWEVKKS